MSGAWIFVCGPSGVGKDSVIDAAQQTLGDRQDIVFARRLVTRPADGAPNHDPVSEPVFVSLLSRSALCWHWQAHGFHYGIDQHYAEAVRAGRRVVVNGSRAHVGALVPSPGVRLVLITADPVDVEIRLKTRARDATQAVSARLARASQCLVDYLNAG